MTARLSVRGKLDRPWDVPCTCGNRYAEHTDGEGCRVCACSRYRSIEAEATAAAEQRLAGLREAIDEAVESLNVVWTETKDGWGGENDRLVETTSALQRARTADDIANGRDWHRPASPRQGEPVDVERLPVLMLFEGWADLLPVGTCWRIAEIRTHVEPSGVKGELGKAQSVIRFDPAPAALSEPAEAAQKEETP